MKRRALVLTNESARHPFRQSLPPHVFDIAPLEAEPENEVEIATWEPGWRDSKFFFQSFAAFFVMAYAFIL